MPRLKDAAYSHHFCLIKNHPGSTSYLHKGSSLNDIGRGARFPNWFRRTNHYDQFSTISYTFLGSNAFLFSSNSFPCVGFFGVHKRLSNVDGMARAIIARKPTHFLRVLGALRLADSLLLIVAAEYVHKVVAKKSGRAGVFKRVPRSRWHRGSRPGWPGWRPCRGAPRRPGWPAPRRGVPARRRETFWSRPTVRRWPPGPPSADGSASCSGRRSPSPPPPCRPSPFSVPTAPFLTAVQFLIISFRFDTELNPNNRISRKSEASGSKSWPAEKATKKIEYSFENKWFLCLYRHPGRIRRRSKLVAWRLVGPGTLAAIGRTFVGAPSPDPTCVGSTDRRQNDLPEEKEADFELFEPGGSSSD